MTANAAKLFVPAYVLLCLLLGGSNHGIWQTAFLQVGAVLLIGLLIATGTKQQLPSSARRLLFLIIGSILLVLLQLVPLPPAIWTKLPGRGPIAESYQALGMAWPWLPLSMTPYGTLNAPFYALPFLAVLLGTILLRQAETPWTVAALIAGTLAGVVLGALQAAGDDGWKIYSITNSGAVGFFANRNFFGTLLLVNIPFAVAVMASAGPFDKNARLTLKVVGAAYLLVVLIGILLNRSLAAAVIAVPVSLASIALLPFRLSFKWYATAFAVIIALGLAFLIAGGQLSSEVIGGDALSIQTRTAIWSQALLIVGDTFPLGSGLGSFSQIYAFYEDPLIVDRWYVNNAHNDYLELVLEMGLPGVILVLAFLGWWALQTKKVWTSPHVDSVARAATIASGAMLAHSIVDYPLRTAAISSLFGFCVGVSAIFEAKPMRSEHPAQRKVRHVRIA
jgi:O-antigen ligase